MKPHIVKAAILLFAVISLATVGFIIVVAEHNPSKELDALAQQFEKSPSANHLRELLNYPADGEYAYLQMALIGKSFAKHPQVYGSVSKTLKTPEERHNIQKLATLGNRVFEYHPERKPADFDRRFEENRQLLIAK